MLQSASAWYFFFYYRAMWVFSSTCRCGVRRVIPSWVGATRMAASTGAITKDTPPNGRAAGKNVSGPKVNGRSRSETPSWHPGTATFSSLSDTTVTSKSTIATGTDGSSTSPRLPHHSQPLGFPLPEDEHACSVSLPTWSAVVGYEEGDPTTVQAMKCGYPRFVYHPYVLQLMEYVLETHGHPHEDCLVLPSANAAIRCRSFLQQAVENKPPRVDNALLEKIDGWPSGGGTGDYRNTDIRLVRVGAADVHAVIFPAETLAGTQAKSYWQHGGEVVSSRRAARCLHDLGVGLHSRITDGAWICHDMMPQSDTAPDYLRRQIARWAKVPSADSVFLAPSGMASIYTALRSARRYQMEKGPNATGGTSIVFGFPYLDTLKLCSRDELCPGGVEFFGHGDAQDLDSLERLLRTKGKNAVCAVFTEVPSNPLLQCPDLYRLRQLADEYDFLLVVDDTISNFLNINVLESGLADVICSSLTKLVSGRGDAMAGSVVTNPHTAGGRWMQRDLAQYYDETSHGGLYEGDACAMVQNSQDFVSRNAVINETSEALASWFQQHGDVEKVYYPKLVSTRDHYEAVRSGGYGGLMSVVLEPHMCQRTFYDALNVAKGPSLGTNFTLVCPYTLLAHYHELDFAMSYNVQPNLLRIAVGLEPLEVLQDKFEEAFTKSRLHPKVCMDTVQQAKQQTRSFSTQSKGSFGTLTRRERRARSMPLLRSSIALSGRRLDSFAL